MNCTICGQPSRVMDTRRPDDEARTYCGRIKDAGEKASWYTYDIIVRRRVCPYRHEWFTIEVCADDLGAMITEGMP